MEVPLDSPMKIYQVGQELDELSSKFKLPSLSAYEIGIDWNLFVIRDEHGINYYANCNYLPIGIERFSTIETDVKTRKRFQVSRWKKILLKGYVLDCSIPKLVPIETEFEDSVSAFMQRAVDFQNGVKLEEIGKEIIIW